MSSSSGSVGESSTGNALLEAARTGDTEAVEKLLRDGVDVNAQDHGGETALHQAVRHGHAHTAACLLEHGANYLLANNNGRTPLSLEYTNLATLHAIRQRYHRFRTGPAHTATSPEVAAWAEELDRHGIIRLSGLIETDALARMQLDFSAFIRNLDQKRGGGAGIYRHYDEEEHWWPKDRAYVTNNAFKYSADLARFCCRPDLATVANEYMGKPAFIQRGVAMRYLPSETTSNDMFGWHHDMEEKRLKVMILLSDVAPDDQYMSYVLGSHRLFHPLVMFLKNQCGLDYCRKHLGTVEVFDTLGKAGDVFLFDSNGSHRGNRRPDARIRDAFFVEYTADPSDIWGGNMAPEFAASMSHEDSNPLQRLLSAEKKWTKPITRKGPTWLENLPQVEKWIRKPMAPAGR